MRSFASQCLLIGSMLTSVGQGQAPVLQSFDARYRAAEAVPADQKETRAKAFAAAFRSFARLESGGLEFRKALPKGARSAVFAGLHREAVPLLDELWERTGGDDTQAGFRLRALFHSGRRHEAVALARTLHEKFAGGVHGFLLSGDFAALAAFAGALLRAGDADGLWLLQTQDLALTGRSGREFSLANLALAYRRLGRVEEAEKAYRSALETAPRAAWIFTDYGLLLKGIGEVGAAVEALVAGLAVESPPGDTAAGTNLGVLFQRTGRDRGRDPQADLVRVLRRRPDAAMARRCLLDGLAAAAK